jgi:hypothetical protein
VKPELIPIVDWLARAAETKMGGKHDISGNAFALSTISEAVEEALARQGEDGKVEISIPLLIGDADGNYGLEMTFGAEELKRFNLRAVGRSKVYMVNTDVTPQPGAKMPERYGGATVKCFIPATTKEEAISMATEALDADHYTVRSVERCVPFFEEVWNDENDPDGDVRKSGRQAVETWQLVYGAFRCWRKDEGRKPD